MKLDGAEVSVGDRLYIVGRGFATVVEINAAMAGVRVGQRIVPVDDRGVVRGASPQSARTVYWHEPYLVAPPKDNAQWVAMREAISYAAATLMDARRTYAALGDDDAAG